jgi:hypothetical protein
LCLELKILNEKGGIYSIPTPMMPATPSAKTVRKPFSIPAAAWDAAPLNVTTEAAGAGAGAGAEGGSAAAEDEAAGGAEAAEDAGADAGLRMEETGGTVTPTVLHA